MFGFQGLRVEKDIDHGIAVLDDLVLCGEQLVCRPEEGCLNLCIGKVRSGAGLIAVVLMIALPDGLSVFAVGVPDLGAIPFTALSAADLAGEKMHTAVPTFTSLSAGKFPLHLLERNMVTFEALSCMFDLCVLMVAVIALMQKHDK